MWGGILSGARYTKGLTTPTPNAANNTRQTRALHPLLPRPTSLKWETTSHADSGAPYPTFDFFFHRWRIVAGSWSCRTSGQDSAAPSFCFPDPTGMLSSLRIDSAVGRSRFSRNIAAHPCGLFGAFGIFPLMVAMSGDASPAVDDTVSAPPPAITVMVESWSSNHFLDRLCSTSKPKPKEEARPSRLGRACHRVGASGQLGVYTASTMRLTNHTTRMLQRHLYRDPLPSCPFTELQDGL